MTPPLACTVRDCGLLLERRDRTWSCARGHSYDLARSGYINLLQPQDRRSLDAGDSREAIIARARLLAQGISRTVVDAVAARVATQLAADAVVADLGSGSGELLGAVYDRTRITGVGIDLSTAGAEHAARRYPHLTWVVANADRRLPLLDHTVDVVVSLHGRRNPSECARVLGKGGRLVVAVPSADDLIELRASVQGQGVERDRGETLVAEHADAFTVLDRDTVREQHHLTARQLRDLLRGTYRGARASEADRLAALDTLDVTLASDVIIFAAR